MPAPTPWVQMMAQQAQQVGPPRSEMSDEAYPQEPNMSQMPEGQVPEITEEEALDLMSSGKVDPRMPVRVVEQKTMRTREPSSGGAQPYDQMMRDIANQYGVQSKAALAAQQQGITQLSGNIDELKNKGRSLDWQPFVAMQKFLSPETDVSAAEQAAKAMAPESQQSRDEKLVNLQNMLQQRKENMSKQQLDTLKEQINAYKASKVDPLDQQLKLSKIGFYGSGREQLQNDRLAFSMHKDIVGKLKTDKILGSRVSQYNNLANALALVDKPDVVPYQQVMELQQAIRKNIGIGGSSGVSERAHTYMDSVGMKTADLKQFLSGDPQDVAKNNPELLHHMKQVAHIEMQNLAQQKDQRIKSLTSGADETVYKNRPGLRKDKDAAAMAAGEQFQNEVSGKAQPEVGEVRKGHKYIGGDPSKPESWEAQ